MPGLGAGIIFSVTGSSLSSRFVMVLITFVSMRSEITRHSISSFGPVLQCTPCTTRGPNGKNSSQALTTREPFH